MSKKENGFMVLLTLILDVVMSFAWYITLYPEEVTSHFDAVVTGALLMCFTIITLVVNVMAYATAIAEGS